MSNGIPKDPDDFFAETRMSFGDHIEELRKHLWKAMYGFALALIFSFFIGRPVVDFITRPVKAELREFYNRRVEKTLKDLADDSNLIKANLPTPFTKLTFRRDQLMAVVEGKSAADINAFKRPVPTDGATNRAKEAGLLDRMFSWKDNKDKKLADDEENVDGGELVGLWVRHEEPLKEQAYLHEAMRIVGDFDTMSTLNVQEAFMVYIKVSMVCGLVLGSPWIFIQIWAFVAAGLYPHERRYVQLYLPVSLGLFLGGVLLCEFFVIPKAIETLLWFNEWMGLKPDLRLNEWLGFAIFMPVVFGLSFQTPLVMLFLERIGIMDIETFRGKRRIAWFAIAVFAAVVTPSTDAVSMLFLWIPMSLLFELGIVLMRLSPRPPDLGIDVPDSEEMVEV